VGRGPCDGSGGYYPVKYHKYPNLILSVHVGYLAHMVIIEQALLRVIRCSAATVILAIHSNHSAIYYQRNINVEIVKLYTLQREEK
jgi:hypothetical protein